MNKDKIQKKLLSTVKISIKEKRDKETVIAKMIALGFKKEDVEEAYIKCETPLLKRIFTKKEKKEEIVEEPLQQKEKTLKETLVELNKNVDLLMNKTVKKGKPFKLPFHIQRKVKSLLKKDEVLVLLMKENRDLEPVIAKIENGMIKVGDKIHKCSNTFVFMWMHKSPCIVLREWELTPIGSKQYGDALNEGNEANAQIFMIRAMEQMAIEGQKKELKLNVVWMVIVGIIVAYVLFANN